MPEPRPRETPPRPAANGMQWQSRPGRFEVICSGALVDAAAHTRAGPRVVQVVGSTVGTPEQVLTVLIERMTGKYARDGAVLGYGRPLKAALALRDVGVT